LLEKCANKYATTKNTRAPYITLSPPMYSRVGCLTFYLSEHFSAM
jgi:hypothetical protein